MSGMTPLLRAQQWPKTMSSWQCQKVVPSFQEPSRDLLSSMLLLTPSLSPRQFPDGPQTLWGWGAPLKALYLLFLLLFMFFAHISTWLTLSLVPSPCISIFLLRTSLTTCFNLNSSIPPPFLLCFSPFCFASCITAYNLQIYFIICLPL